MVFEMTTNTVRAFSDEVEVCKDFRKKQKLARLSGKCYITQNKLRQIPDKKPPSEEVSSLDFILNLGLKY